MSLMSAVFMVVLLLFVSSSQSDPTTIQWWACSTETVQPNDPYITYCVISVLDDIVIATSSESNLKFSTSVTDHSRSGGPTAYGYGVCDPKMSRDDCSDCLRKCAMACLDVCGTAVGAQMAMWSCYIRYENYSFM